MTKRSVIELGIQPVRRRMAAAAIMRQAQLKMTRVIGSDEFLAMAGIAVGRCPLELVIEMAGIAIQRRVHSGEREAGEFQVIKLGSKPGIHVVARLAGRREAQPYMVEDWCLIVLDMAAVASR